MALKDQIQSIIKGEVLDDQQTLNTYSKDASIFIIKPQLVVFPKDSEDIKALVKYINENPEQNLSLTPRAAATCMSGGPLNDSIILDMTKYFNSVLEVGDNFAMTQPGVFYRDFEKKTLEKGLILPCYTSSREICTVGGMVGNNAAGEKSLSFGQTEKWVRKLKVILSDGNEYEIYPIDKNVLSNKVSQNNLEGEIYKKISELINENLELIKSSQPHTSKNSTGYYLWKVSDEQTFDLTKLIVGSQGTLGIVTEIEFQLIKPKPQTAMLEIELQNLEKLDQIVNTVLEFKPESFECFDDATLKAATKYIGEIAKDFKKTHGFEVYLKILPEYLMSLAGQLPKLILIAEFTGENEGEEIDLAQKAKEALTKFNIHLRVIHSNDEEKYWIIRRDSFNILRHHSGENMRTAPFIDDIIISPKDLPQFLPRLQELLKQYEGKIIYTIAGHIGNGNFHIIPLMNFSDENIRSLIPEISEKVFNLVFEFKGSMAAEHNDGLVRGPYLPKMYGEQMYQLFKEVKEIFDPKKIFNPHKKTDATIKYSMDHLDHGVKLKEVEDYAATPKPT